MGTVAAIDSITISQYIIHVRCLFSGKEEKQCWNFIPDLKHKGGDFKGLSRSSRLLLGPQDWCPVSQGFASSEFHICRRSQDFFVAHGFGAVRLLASRVWSAQILYFRPELPPLPSQWQPIRESGGGLKGWQGRQDSDFLQGALWKFGFALKVSPSTKYEVEREGNEWMGCAGGKVKEKGEKSKPWFLCRAV